MVTISKEGKKDLVRNLKSKFEKSASSVLANYHGLSVSQLQELKKELKGAYAEFTVTKNTLLDRASKEAGKKIQFTVNKGCYFFINSASILIGSIGSP